MNLKFTVLKGEFLVGTLEILQIVLPRLGLKRLTKALYLPIIERSRLFDYEHYASENADVIGGSYSMIEHYVLFGWQEKRNPSYYFDSLYYERKVNKKININHLVHYHLLGRYKKKSPSPYFDFEKHIKLNKSQYRKGEDLLLRFIENQKTKIFFSGLDQSQYTRKEKIIKSFLASQGSPENKDYVDIIIPIYENFELTMRCIYSVLNSNNKINLKLIVVDDKSTSLEIRQELIFLEKNNCIHLISNLKNKGFVHSINKGIKASKSKNVVILNSDVEVFNDWLDRLLLYTKKEMIGTITPLSNNGDICSYPVVGDKNRNIKGIKPIDIDKACSSIEYSELIVAPTGVGFCMLITRDCYEKVGEFNEKVFGLGYCEENDFCQRAEIKGFKNIIATNTYVWHYGGGSFKGRSYKLTKDNLKKLNEIHPEYLEKVSEFKNKDQLKYFRKELDIKILKRNMRKKNVLLVSHSRGGGSEKHLKSNIVEYKEKGFGVFILRPLKYGMVVLADSDGFICENLKSISLSAELEDILINIKISHIHIHSLVDYDLEAAKKILTISKNIYSKLCYEVHDYHSICPRINLIDDSMVYCEEKGDTFCTTCLGKSSDFKYIDIKKWKQDFECLLENADEVLVPDLDVKERLMRYFGDLDFTIEPHEPDLKNFMFPQLEKVDGIKRILLIGAISHSKGFKVLYDMAKFSKKNREDIKFVLYGYSLDDNKLESVGVEILGQYDDNAINLDNVDFDIIWLPSIWPETYSYTLDISLMTGAPIMCFDIGAIPRRLKELNRRSLVMPLSYSESPERILRKIRDFK